MSRPHSGRLYLFQRSFELIDVSDIRVSAGEAADIAIDAQFAFRPK
jgi:hypothetical protein